MKRLCALMLLVALGPALQACPIDSTITVIAANASAQEIKTFRIIGETKPDQSFSWKMAPGEEGSILDAHIDKLELSINLDPWVSLEFAVRAGSSATQFTVLSDLVVFAPLTNPLASAATSITLTDRSVSPVGATITGLFDGGAIYQAKYNGIVAWSNLAKPFSVTRPSPGSTASFSVNDSKPAIDAEIITDTVSSIESRFSFTLSALDSASGTSDFVVIPEPISLSILLGGTMLVFAKRK